MIIKALEICSNDEIHSCEGCPFDEPFSMCISKLMKQASEIIKSKDSEIDIILRKKHALRDEIAEKDAEIERLKTNLKEAHIDIREHITRIESLKKANEEMFVAIDKLYAENERLKNAYKQCAWERDVYMGESK